MAASAKRSSAIPELPTVAESALVGAGYEVVQWNGVLARLNTEIERILALPETRSRMAADGADIDPWSKVIKAANVQVD